MLNIYYREEITICLLHNKQIVITFALCYDTTMFDKVEGLNDREEMLDHLRFLIRYEKEILEDGIIFFKIGILR